MTLVTNAFMNLARSEAQFFGIPSLPFVEVPHHPWYAVTPEEWCQDAEQALGEVASRLMAPVVVVR